jgi:prepilin-type N-terminal cleavage/methylation domain-containing protein
MNSTRPSFPKSAASRRTAFTLLEVLVAMTILSLTLVVLYQGFSSQFRLLESSRNMWRAMQFTNNELSQWQRRPVPSVSVSQGTFPDDHPLAGYAWKREVSDNEPLPGITVRKIAYELDWSEGTAQRHFQSYIYVEPN